MKAIKKTEPDLIIRTKPYTEAERKRISEIIAKSKEKAAKDNAVA